MTRSERFKRDVPSVDLAGGRSAQHISSIAHLFFSEEETTSEGSAPEPPGCRLLVIGSGKASLAPNLAAGLARQILAGGQAVPGNPRAGRDTSLRQVFLGEISPVHFSAFNHLSDDCLRPPRPEESVPWSHQPGVPGVARVFNGEVPREDFTAGRELGRYFLRHMDLPRERELLSLEARRSVGAMPEVARDGTRALIWCLTADEGPSLEATSRLGRLLRLTQSAELHVVMARQKGRAGQVRRERAERLVRFVAAEVPVAWYELGPDRSERLALHAELARLMAP